MGLESNKREYYKKGLSPLYLPYYQALCDNLDNYWQPYCGYRSIEDQVKLYAIGRMGKEGEKPVTKAKGGESAHQYGCGSDWCIWVYNKPEWNKKNKKWIELEQACAKAGLLWGGLFGDWPHVELSIKVSWKEVNQVRIKEGDAAAQEFIKQNMF